SSFAPFRVAMNLDARAWNLGFDGRDDALREVVRAEEALVARDFEVQLDELDGAGAARAQVVEADDALRVEAADDGGHSLVNLLREPPVHQHVNRVARHTESRP